MNLEAPALLLLALPLGILYWKALRPPGQGPLRTTFHVLLLALLVLTLAGPTRRVLETGLDVVVVVDRSRSMPPDADARMLELIHLIERQRPAHSRVGVVTVGAHAHVEQLPTSEGRFGGFTRAIDPDASALAEGIETATHLIPTGRGGRIVVFSDGLPTGRSPLAAATTAASRNLPIDYRLFSRPRANDLAIERIHVPLETDAGAAFRFTTWVSTDDATPIRYRCYRNDTLIASGETTVPAGSHPLQFQDRLPREGGLYRYRTEVERLQGEDPIPENNIATAVLRAHDAPCVLVVSTHPSQNNVVASLRTAGFQVDACTPDRMPQDAATLDAYRAVLLEDVSANDVGAPAMLVLRRYVEEEGGGLLISGGRASFGVGGYFQSDLDPILPVSMEVREEHRKFRLAMAIALDRSGSMTAPVGGGLVKMDLANRGTAEAIKTLSAMDEVAVIAVDSAAHLMVPLTPVKQPAPLINKVLRIQSEGGGIFVYTALMAAGAALEKSTAATRHIVLFADAADAEEPGDYVELLAKYQKAGITVSVIGLGIEADSDAVFLKDVAARGGGRIFFTERPEDLPRLFAHETLSVARSSFVEEAVAVRWRPDVHLLGDLARLPLPTIQGYNLTYLRENAALAAVSEDEYKAPILAFWHRGVGRVAAFTAEADGKTSASLLQWNGYATLFVELARWLMGPPEPEGVSVTARVNEPDVVLRFEFDPDSAAGRDLPKGTPTLSLLSNDPSRTTAVVPFEWVGDHALEARFSLEREGVTLPVVRFGSGKIIKAPPVTLPYSPEYLPRRSTHEEQLGEGLLDELAKRTQGQRLASVDGLFNRPEGRVWEQVSLRPLFAIVFLVLFILDIALRRLRLWDLPVLVRLDATISGLFRRRVLHPSVPAPASRPEARLSSVPPAIPPPPTEPAIADALAQAKKRARKRYGER